MASQKCALCQHRFAKFYRPPDGSEPIGAWPRCRTCTTGGLKPGPKPKPIDPESMAAPVVEDVQDISEAEIEARYWSALMQIKARNKAARMVEVSSLC